MSPEQATLAVPEAIRTSRPLTEAHRLDLALFVVFEEASVRIAESLLRHASPGPLLDLATRQFDEDSRHLNWFNQRLDESLLIKALDPGQATEALLLRTLQGVQAPAAAPLQRANMTSAVVIPPLRRYLEQVRQAAERGDILATLVLHHLLLKDMACALAAHEEHYWRPFDPYLADLIRIVADEEGRHVELAACIVRKSLPDDPGRRGQFSELCAGGHARLQTVFRYYVRKFVELFAVVARQQGQPAFAAPVEEQIALIEASCAARHAATRTQAGIKDHGYQESLSHA